MKALCYYDIVDTVFYFPECKMEIRLNPINEFTVEDRASIDEHDITRAKEVEINLTEVQLLTFINVKHLIEKELNGKD